MESQAALLAWLHGEMGYDFRTLAGLTYPELGTLQLGYAVRNELQADEMNAAASGNSTVTERNKREHRERIVRQVATG